MPAPLGDAGVFYEIWGKKSWTKKPENVTIVDTNTVWAEISVRKRVRGLGTDDG
jgi:hypothetical protein